MNKLRRSVSPEAWTRIRAHVTGPLRAQKGGR
jgi:hypothetical protein